VTGEGFQNIRVKSPLFSARLHTNYTQTINSRFAVTILSRFLASTRWPLKGSTPMLRLDQRHTLKAFRASVGDEEGHKADCILVQKAGQALKIHSYLSPLENLLPISLPSLNLRE
jgi:hypothetical protein